MTWYEQTILTSLVCIGLKVCYAPGKIFSFVGSLLMKIFNKGGIWCYIAMPLGACHYCMASVYGVSVHLFLCLVGIGVASAQLPLILLSVVVMNGILYGLLEKFDKHLFQ
jgi:hypothetical protein